MGKIWRGAAVVIALLALTACGPSATPTPDGSTPTATESGPPSPTAEPTPQPSATRPPVQAFDGDCTQVFSNAELSNTFGVPMTDLGVNWSIGQEEALGGLKCTWWSDDLYLGAIVVLTALPAATAPESVSAATQCRADYQHCEATLVTAHGWYSLTVYGHMTTGEPAVASDLLATAAGRGDALPAAAIPPTTAATWERPTPECAALGSYLMAPSGSPVDATQPSPDGDSLLVPLYNTLGDWCYFTTMAPDETGTTMEAFIAVAVVPGGAVAFDAGVVSGRGEPVQITNGTAAEVIMPFVAEGNPGIFATDGTNTIAVSTPLGFAPADFTWVAEQLIDALAP